MRHCFPAPRIVSLLFARGGRQIRSSIASRVCVRMAFVALLAFGASTLAHADPITYTLTGTFSGTLGAQSFTDAAGTIQFVGDDSGVTSLGAGFYTNTAGVSTITLANIGTAVFLSPTFGAESETNGAGFYDIANGFGASIYDPTLGSYALTAPFSDTGYLQLSFATAFFGTTETTDLGELSLTGDINSSATFTATGATAAATPEPGSLALLATGLISVAGLCRYRWKQRILASPPFRKNAC